MSKIIIACDELNELGQKLGVPSLLKSDEDLLSVQSRISGGLKVQIFHHAVQKMGVDVENSAINWLI